MSNIARTLMRGQVYCMTGGVIKPVTGVDSCHKLEHFQPWQTPRMQAIIVDII